MNFDLMQISNLMKQYWQYDSQASQDQFSEIAIPNPERMHHILKKWQNDLFSPEFCTKQGFEKIKFFQKNCGQIQNMNDLMLFLHHEAYLGLKGEKMLDLNSPTLSTQLGTIQKTITTFAKNRPNSEQCELEGISLYPLTLIKYSEAFLQKIANDLKIQEEFYFNFDTVKLIVQTYENDTFTRLEKWEKELFPSNLCSYDGYKQLKEKQLTQSFTPLSVKESLAALVKNVCWALYNTHLEKKPLEEEQIETVKNLFLNLIQHYKQINETCALIEKRNRLQENLQNPPSQKRREKFEKELTQTLLKIENLGINEEHACYIGKSTFRDLQLFVDEIHVISHCYLHFLTFAKARASRELPLPEPCFVNRLCSNIQIW